MLLVCSQSKSFTRHIEKIFGLQLTVRSRLLEPDIKNGKIQIVHAASYSNELFDWLSVFSKSTPVAVAVAADAPNVAEMLDLSHRGVKAYCNSYMAAPHYQQLHQLLENGQTWYPPSLLAQAFEVARKSINRSEAFNALNQLTPREKEISFAVADGKSNKLVAQQFGISERTVKAHLTNIFEKLQVKDRVALVIYLNQYNFRQEDKAAAS